MGGKKQLESIEDLKPAPYNPRKIGKGAVEGLAASLKKFADISGIVWNKRTGNLVCGHQRVEQLRKQGAELRDGALVLPGGDRWPVRVVEWTVAQEKTANVAANNPHVAGEFTDGLGDILADIKLSIGDEDFTGLRFDELGGFNVSPLDEMPELVTDDDPLFGTMTFTLSRDQQAAVRSALAKSKKNGGEADESNKNKSGNCLAFLCREYLNG